MSSKRKLKDILSLGSANLVTGIIFGLFWMFLASILTKSEYGELGYLMSIVNVFAIIALLGLGVIVVVYEPKKENIFPASIVVTVIAAIVVGIISYVLTQNFIISLFIIGLTIFSMTIAGLDSKKRFVDHGKNILLRSTISIISAIILYQFFDLNGILLGYLVATLVCVKDLYSLLKNKKLEFSLLKPKIGFSLKMLTIRLSGVFLRWGDKTIIGAMFGFSFLGNYHFAAQYLFLLEAVPRSIGRFLLPYEAEGEKNTSIKIFSVTVSVIIAIVSIFLIPIGVNAFFPNFIDSISSMQILSIAVIPLSISSIQQAEFLGRENSNVVLIGSVIRSGIYLLFIIFLGQTLGLNGIAIGFLVAAIFITIFNFFVRKIIDNSNS